MEIRLDLRKEAALLSRLIEYAEVFRSNNMEDWPHLKNNEDFRQVYQLPWDLRGPLEAIYGDGRDLASFMASRLLEFNDAKAFPTLKLFVDSFTGGWIDQIDLLKDVSQNAKTTVSKLDNAPWAISKMIRLFDEQIELLAATRLVIHSLRDTATYAWESNTEPVSTQTAEYERILVCINLIGKMFERLPSTYADKEEEHLRDHILVTLGATMIGSATGETFNKRGKTDILVRGSDFGSNEFVGECKFWRGEVVYHQTIDQLLSYLSWRDNKAAIILFVPNKGFSSVLQTIRDTTPRHAQFLRLESEADDSWFNYIFTIPGDDNRIIQLAIMAYHMPSDS